MTPQDERAVERYIIDPTAMTDKERQAVEALLSRDAAARAWADMLRDTYDTAFKADASPQADALVDRLFPEPTVIQMHRVRHLPPTETTVAAADDPSVESMPDTDAPHRVQVAMDKAEKVMVRLICPTDASPGRLYILSGRTSAWAYAMVSFPDLNLDLPTNADGVGIVPPGTACESDWQQIHLRRVIASTRMTATDRTRTFDSGHTFRLQFQDGHVHVRLTTKPMEAAVVRRVHVAASAVDHPERYVGRLQRGAGTIPLPSDAGPLMMRLYG